MNTRIKRAELARIEEQERAQLEAGFMTEQELAALKSRQNIHGYEIGYFVPSGANWSYIVELVMVDGQLYEVFGKFGSIDHARKVSLINFETQTSGEN